MLIVNRARPYLATIYQLANCAAGACVVCMIIARTLSAAGVSESFVFADTLYQLMLGGLVTQQQSVYLLWIFIYADK